MSWVHPSLPLADSPAPSTRRRESSWSVWLLTLAALAPVWCFTYIPTQDGPAHLSSAWTLRALWQSQSQAADFFQIRTTPVPNWLAQLLLTGLLLVFPPLIAEKIFVTLYIIGLVVAVGEFLEAAGSQRRLAGTALLLVFSRCFWLGFYNFCLSLVLYWFLLAWLLRRAAGWRWTDDLVLAGLFLLTYFSHLFGFLLALGSAGWLAVTTHPRPGRRLCGVFLAAMPSLILGIYFLYGNGFFSSPGAQRLVTAPLSWTSLATAGQRLGIELVSFGWQLVGPQTAGSPLPGLIFWLLAALLGLAATGASRGSAAGTAGPWPRRWPLTTLGIFFVLLYLFVPDHLGELPNSTEHGGFLKARLALIPLICWLACVPFPASGPVSRAGCYRLLPALITVLAAGNLALVWRYCQQGNADLAEYTAGIPRLGKGHVLFVVPPEHEGPVLADPLLHAAGYYALATESINLENYQPATNHFPLSYRPGVTRGWGDFRTYPQRERVDVLLAWDSPAPPLPAGWRAVYRQGRLQLFLAAQARD
jgi:hypothetical protein